MQEIKTTENMQKNNFKVVFIHPDLGIGGAERLVLDAAIALQEQNVQVSFITNHFDKNHCFQELKEDTIPVKVYGNWIPRSILGFFHALMAYLKMLYLSLIYLYFLKEPDAADVYFVDQIPVAIPLLKKKSMKVIYYCHHPDMLLSSPGGLLKKLYRLPINRLEGYSTGLADVILVNSYYTSQVFKNTFPRIRKHIRILYPTITPKLFNLLEHANNNKCLEMIPELEFANTDDNIVFLSINRFHPAKNIELAMEALHYLKHQLHQDIYNHVYLLIAGGCDPMSPINIEYYQKLTLETFKLGVYAQVFFVKSPPDTVKANLIVCSDCVLYTPIKEHFGIVPLESMAGGTPVIACNSGGPRETIEHNVTGYLCEPNAIDMAKYMKKIVCNRLAAKEMGKTAKHHCHERFSYEKFKAEIKTVVEDLVVNDKTQKDFQRLDDNNTKKLHDI